MQGDGEREFFGGSFEQRGQIGLVGACPFFEIRLQQSMVWHISYVMQPYGLQL
jgi:hypothetical protein